MANVLPFARRVEVASHLVDGCSINATSRLLKIHKQTILDFLVLLGEGCARLHDRVVRDVVTSDVEMDEIWSFVWKKQHRCGPNDPSEWGDNYTFVAMARATRLVISYLTGPRDGTSAFVFAHDLKRRIVTTPGRVHVSSDGFVPYIPAMRAAFGLRVDYGQVVKNYRTGSKRGPDHRYEPPRDPFITKTPIMGAPDMDQLSTSYVERNNLTMRHIVGRTRRLCLAFSKTLRGHRAAEALGFMAYNFVRIHSTIGCTPAMAAGLSDHVWDVEELVQCVLAEPMPEPAPLAPIPSPDGWQPPVQLGLFDGPSGILPKLLPPSVGGTPSANDNAAPAAPNVADSGDDEEGPATMRDPAPWGAAAAPSVEWYTLQAGDARVV